jgi:hypothetical protein
MTRDDEPTKPLPTADTPTEVMTAPGEVAPEATEPIIAPHVPIAEVRTADLPTVSSEPTVRRRGAGWLLGVLGTLAAAAVIGSIVALIIVTGGPPTPAPTTSVSPSPAATVATDPDPEPATPVAPPPPPDPGEPTPEPTPTTEPTPEPTPTETP